MLPLLCRGTTGTAPICRAGGASAIGSSIGSSSRGTTSAACNRSRGLRRYSVPLRLTMYDRGWPSPWTTIAADVHTMIVAHANPLALLELRQLSRSSVEDGLVTSLSLLELWSCVNDIRFHKCKKDLYLRVKHSTRQHLGRGVRHSGHGCVAVR